MNHKNVLVYIVGSINKAKGWKNDADSRTNLKLNNEKWHHQEREQQLPRRTGPQIDLIPLKLLPEWPS